MRKAYAAVHVVADPFAELASSGGHLMIADQESAKSTQHLAQIIRLASDSGLFPDPELTASRARTVLATHGVET